MNAPDSQPLGPVSTSHLMTSQDYRESLRRLKPVVFVDGRRIDSVADEPSLRAFDTRHDGTLLGEGAGFMVLEDGSLSSARGREPLALLRGVGSANDAAGMTTPDSEGRGARLAA